MTKEQNNKMLALKIELRKTYKNDTQNTIFNIYNELKETNLKKNGFNFYNIILNDSEFLSFIYSEVFYYNGLTLEETKQAIKY